MKKTAIGLGTLFIVIFLISFVENPIVGENGLLATNLAHDIFHLATGIILIIMGLTTDSAAKLGFRFFGIIYGLITLVGFVMIPDGGSLFDIFDMSSADHYLHLLLALVFVYLGFLSHAGAIRLPEMANEDRIE